MKTETPNILPRIAEALTPLGGTVETTADRLFQIKVPPNSAVSALKVLVQELGVKHLSTITGLDAGDRIDVNYQFSYANKIITVKTSASKSDPKLETSTKIIPGAILYEMEVHDMFGVDFIGNPWMDRKLLLPDSYPASMPPPLLKSTSSEAIRKAEGIEKKNA